eukprot:gene17342-biopygen12870
MYHVRRRLPPPPPKRQEFSCLRFNRLWYAASLDGRVLPQAPPLPPAGDGAADLRRGSADEGLGAFGVRPGGRPSHSQHQPREPC